MPTTLDLAYYTRRERQERAPAERADHDIGRHIHLEMARRYARMIAEEQADTPQPRPTLRISVPR